MVPPPPSEQESLVVLPGDALKITVWPDEQLGGEFVVEESGYVYLPVLGQVKAGGVSVEELRARLREGYSVAMKSPVVGITPMFRVGVLGQVQRPGVYAITPTQSLFDVIALAGGFGAEANQEKVRIVRSGEVVEVNASAMLERGELGNDLMLRSGDQIVVPTASRGLSLSDARSVLFVVQTVLLLVTLANRL